MLLNVEYLRGELVLGTGTVNSGKSEDLIETDGKLRHSRYRNSYLIFGNSRNTRDGANTIGSSSGMKLENVGVADAENPDEILSIVAKREVGRPPLDILIFEEGNLHTHKFVPVTESFRKKGKVVVVYGLDLDFRGEPFGPMGRLREIANTRESISGKRLVHMFESYCCVIDDDGKQCGKPAGYTLRVVKDNGRQELKYLDEKGVVVRGFTKALYFGPTIIIQGSKTDIDYTTACEEHFGELPGRKLVHDVLLHVQREQNERAYEIIAKKFRERSLPEVIAYAIEERKLNVLGGLYRANSNVEHPTWDEAVGLVELGKVLDSPGENNTIEVYRMIKENDRGAKRELVIDRFRKVQNRERILSGLIANNFISLEGAVFTPVVYIRDIPSGMYVPMELANQ